MKKQVRTTNGSSIVITCTFQRRCSLIYSFNNRCCSCSNWASRTQPATSKAPVLDNAGSKQLTPPHTDVDGRAASVEGFRVVIRDVSGYD
jgi:hypothetical protein